MTERVARPIDAAIENWHAYLAAPAEARLDALLADDVVFYSPVVFTPQRGKDITKLYLLAAAQTLPGEGDATFRYTKQVVDGDTAVLEFETSVGGKHVNGVDILRVDDQGLVVEFRVMLRPLQAVNAVHEQMRAMLESMAP